MSKWTQPGRVTWTHPKTPKQKTKVQSIKIQLCDQK